MRQAVACFILKLLLLKVMVILTNVITAPFGTAKFYFFFTFLLIFAWCYLPSVGYHLNKSELLRNANLLEQSCIGFRETLVLRNGKNIDINVCWIATDKLYLVFHFFLSNLHLIFEKNVWTIQIHIQSLNHRVYVFKMRHWFFNLIFY